MKGSIEEKQLGHFFDEPQGKAETVSATRGETVISKG